MRLDTILAPTDLEDDSLPGLETAAQLARDNGARLVVAHVITSRDVDTSTPWHEKRPLRDQLLAQAESRMSEQLQGLVDGVDAEPLVGWGDPVGVLLDTATRVGADVIVITGKHRSRVGKAIMGSQAQRLILESDRPVLTVPIRRP